MVNRFTPGMLALAAGLAFGVSVSPARADVVKPASDRFASAEAKETPDFRRHVVPLLGRLGCNGRACHGSFKGQGGFRLSLFGYDFKMDHEGLIDRVDTDTPEDSYALQKATLTEPHRGGKRTTKGSWEYNVLKSWIAGGAENVDLESSPKFVGLEVTPKEILFRKDGQTTPLKVIAVWSDGSKEDVTCLSRFKTNDEQVAEVSTEGVVTSHQAGDSHVVIFYDNGVVPIPVIRPVSDKVDSNYPVVKTGGRVDELVVAKLRKLGMVPSAVADDAQFLRRVSLDITGTLPSPKEIREFLADESSDKRAEKIDELLNRPTYAAWWATRFCDWTGNNDDQLNNVTPVRSQASQDWYDWIEKRVASNVPYDQLVEGIVMGSGRQRDESYRDYCKEMSEIYYSDSGKKYADRDTLAHYWARRNFRTPEDRAISFAYTFMGIRIQCAQCHKHPFDEWTQDDFHQFKNFFANTQIGNGPDYAAMLKELGIDTKKLRGGQLRNKLRDLVQEGRTVPFQEVYTPKALTPEEQQALRKNEKGKKPQRKGRRPARATEAKVLGGGKVNLTEFQDSRTPLMAWLRSDKKRLMARAIVNRVWANYFNVGIVEPPDDLSLANPPSNAALLDYLVSEFISQDYDLKWLHREICNSDTYQRSWQPNDTNAGDERNFSRAVPRRMPAEVAYDALVAATGSDDLFKKMHAEPDARTRAIAIPGASARRRGNDGRLYALEVFGRSIRESNCDCDRSMESSLLQTVFLQNDDAVLDMIDRPKDGFVGQVAQELGLKQTRVAKNSTAAVQQKRRIDAARKQIASFKTQLKKAEKKGNEIQVKQLQRRIASMKKRIADTTGASSEEGEQTRQKAAAEKLPQIVRSTYLRTLSRMPTDDELSKSVAYIESSDDAVKGVSDLLWALVNTKEFIVNH